VAIANIKDASMAELALSEQPTNAAARAAGSSFYAAMRILPKHQREAMFEIYSFCRAVDDVADDPGERGARATRLQQWRRDIDALYAGTVPAHLAGLAQAVRDFGLDRADFIAVIDGMQMDVDADIRAPDWATLDLYCDRVASAVGRLSVRVFGMAAEDGIHLAHHLGRALQLTNILRDLDEDAAVGRLYLPREALRDAGITTDDPNGAIADPRIDRACRPVVERAQTHFREAETIMARASRASVRAPRMMGEAYRSILAALLVRGFAPPRRPVKLSRARLLLIVLRHAFF
jgi:squalene synthase HpnD